MLKQFLQDVHVTGLLTQYSHYNKVFSTSETKDILEKLEQSYYQNHKEGLFFISGIAKEVGMKRCSDKDIAKKSYVAFDFDIRKDVEKDGFKITDKEIKEMGLHFGEKLKETEFSDWKYIVFTGNGIHIYYICDSSVINSKEHSDGYNYYKDKISKILGFEADKACRNCARILRLPTTYNNKNGNHIKGDFIATTDAKSDLLQKILTKGRELKEEPREIKKTVIKSENKIIKHSPVVESILQIPMSEIVLEHFPDWVLEPNNRNFRTPSGNLSAAFLSDRVDNVLWLSDSREFNNIPFKALNPFTFVKHMKKKEGKELFNYFYDRYSHIKAINEVDNTIEEIEVDVNKEIELNNAEVDFSKHFNHPEDHVPFTWFTEKCNSTFPPIEDHQLIFVAGAPSSGKTTLTVDMAIKNAREGKKVLYISLEMHSQNIIISLSRKRFGITKEQWRDKTLISEYDKKQAIEYCSMIQSIDNLQFFSFKESSPTTENIQEVIKNTDCDIVFIDNFNLVHSEEGDQNKKDAFISGSFLKFTNEYNIPVVFIHHLSKQKKGDVLNLNSMRGSGKIADNSDTVIGVIRNYASEDLQDLDEADKCKTKLVCHKDRSFGDGGVAEIFFKKGSFVDEYYKNSVSVKDVKAIWGDIN